MTKLLGAHLMELYVPRARKFLAGAAREHRLVHYMEITRMLGTSRAWIGQVLDELNRREHSKGHPIISAIVVRADSRESSDGFFKLVESLRPGSTRLDERQLWESERDRVWAFDWSD